MAVKWMLGLAPLVLAACGTSSPATDGPMTMFDASASDAAGGDLAIDPHTVGKACTALADCAANGASANVCSNAAFQMDPLAPGSALPDPVCVGLTCDPGNGMDIPLCDGGKGYCTNRLVNRGPTCMPVCRFDNSTAMPTGCSGHDVCNGDWYDRINGGITGTGYCYWGCISDGDCKAGDHCQVGTGRCVKTPALYTLKVGDPCTNNNADSCACTWGPVSGKGYCQPACRVGDGASPCPGGFTCDPRLTASDNMGAVFTAQPVGLYGHCQKNCATDVDCMGLNATCRLSGGATQKTCFVGS